MGKKLDVLLRRSSKPAKFKSLVNLAVSRLAVLKHQRQVKCSQARSDVLHLLNLSQHEHALLRVQQVIKEQNMFDVFVMLEGYCHLLIERIDLIEQDRLFPDELKEAVATLLYASSRCGEFPELLEIRSFLSSRYGKEFVARAIELRNGCGVNPKTIQKLSTKMPSLDSRMKALKEIASENNIVLQFDDNSATIEEKNHGNPNQQKPRASPAHDPDTEDRQISSQVTEKEGEFSGSKKKYRDVADAAQAAFESAAYAAAAARAAVELSRSHPHDPDEQSNQSPRRRQAANSNEPVSSMTIEVEGLENPDNGLGSHKIHPLETNDFEEGGQGDSEACEQIHIKKVDDEVVFDQSEDEGVNTDTSFYSPNMKTSSLRMGSGLKNPLEYSVGRSGMHKTQLLDLEKRPISVRTRRGVMR